MLYKCGKGGYTICLLAKSENGKGRTLGRLERENKNESENEI